MKKNVNGFFVMEFLVYFFLFSCISYCLMHFVVSSSLRLRKESKKLVAITELLTALDYIGNVLQDAPSDLRLWKEKNNELLIWHDAERNIDIGIGKIKNKIWRMVGTYSIFKKSWLNKKKELLATHVKDLSFVCNKRTFNKRNLVEYITCIISIDLGAEHDTAYTIEKSVVLENRILS